MKAYRAAILRFDPFAPPHSSAVYEEDGLLVVGPGSDGVETVHAVGTYCDVVQSYPNIETEHLRGRIIAPGFIDP